MLKIIEPNSHELYQPEINALLYLFKLSHNYDFKLPLEEQEKATFIVAEDSKCGIYGGAILRKKPLEAFEKEIEAIFSTFYSYRTKIWNVHLCFYIEAYENLPPQEKLRVLRDFYPQLFKKLRTFGKQQKTSCLVLSLKQSEHFMTSTHFEWPYILEVPLHNSLDSLFHGILSFKPPKDPDHASRKRFPNTVNQAAEVVL